MRASNTIECRYNGVQDITSKIITETEAEYQSDAGHPNGRAMGCLFHICEKIDRVITALHCM